MCRVPKKNNDTPLVENHKLLSSIYTAEFFSGNNGTASSAPLKTVNCVFNTSIVERGAIPKDASSKIVKAFAPKKAGMLLVGEKEWKCICCNGHATQFCSSIVGKAPSMGTVICFTEKIYVVCSDEECIAKVTQKKNEDSRKLDVSDFDFRFSFRSALRPIRIDDRMSIESTLKMTAVEDTVEKKAEKESAIAEEANHILAMEKEIAKKTVDKESNAQRDSKSSVNLVSNETKKRKRGTDNCPTQALNPNRNNGETMHKRIKNIDNLSSVSKSVQCPATNGSKKRDDEEVKENVGENATEANNTEPAKVYLREFPFVFDGKGAWLCRHCLGVPCHAGSHHYFSSPNPPPNNFVDRHLRLCPVMSRHFPSHE